MSTTRAICTRRGARARCENSIVRQRRRSGGAAVRGRDATEPERGQGLGEGETPGLRGGVSGRRNPMALSYGVVEGWEAAPSPRRPRSSAPSDSSSRSPPLVAQAFHLPPVPALAPAQSRRDLSPRRRQIAVVVELCYSRIAPSHRGECRSPSL